MRNKLGVLGLTFLSGLPGSKARAMKVARDLFERQVEATAASDRPSYEAATRVSKRVHTAI